VTKKQAEKILKYKGLAIQIQRRRDLTKKVIPVIIWQLESQSRSENTDHETGKARNQGATKNSHIGHFTRHIYMRNNITLSINCKRRIATKVYILVTSFISGVYL
jgi:hypothetical protein